MTKYKVQQVNWWLSDDEVNTLSQGLDKKNPSDQEIEEELKKLSIPYTEWERQVFDGPMRLDNSIKLR